MDFRIPFFRGIPYFVPYSVFTRKKLNFAKFRGLPYSIFWRNSVFCSVFRFYVEKIKFREILWTSVFRFFAEFRILFRIPFLRGKNQIPRNFAEFRIPYSVFHIYFVFFRKIPQKIRNGNDGIPVNSVRNFSKILTEFISVTELNLDFRYNTT